MHNNDQQQTDGINENVTLTAADLLAGIVSSRWSTAIGGLDALGVENPCRWLIPADG
jgi:hypothetical protein